MRKPDFNNKHERIGFFVLNGFLISMFFLILGAFFHTVFKINPLIMTSYIIGSFLLFIFTVAICVEVKEGEISFVFLIEKEDSEDGEKK